MIDRTEVIRSSASSFNANREIHVGRVHVNVRVEDDFDADYSWLGEFVDEPDPLKATYSFAADAVRLPGPRQPWRDRKGRIVSAPESLTSWRDYDFLTLEHGGDGLAGMFADADRMVGLSRGEWGFVGIVATVSVDHPGYVPREIGHASCWGFESDSPDYLRTEARNLASEAISDARTFVRELVTA